MAAAGNRSRPPVQKRVRKTGIRVIGSVRASVAQAKAGWPGHNHRRPSTEITMSSLRRLARNLVAVFGLLLVTLPAFAQSEDDLLPVTEAFHLTSDASQPGMVKLHWRIAPDYYLYRGRIKIKAADPAAVSLGDATLPDGIKKHDEYLGDVEIYHGDIEATVPYKLLAASTTALALDVQYQGCHEVEPKICYPPNTEHLKLTIGGASTIPTGA